MIDDRNKLKLKLKNNEPILGVWSIISSPIVVEILGLSGFDFLILDMEHGIYDQTALDACIRACEASGCSPIVRVPGMSQSAVQWALDLGAHGIVVPQVHSAESARVAVEMAKFPPLGTRGYNPFTRFAKYAAPQNNHRYKLRNDFVLTSVIVENPGALEDLDKILVIEQLDVIYIGVYDLSISLGFDGDVSHPKLIQIVNESIKKIIGAKKVAGMMVRNKEEVVSATKLGVNFLVYTVDSLILKEAAISIVNTFKHSVMNNLD